MLFLDPRRDLAPDLGTFLALHRPFGVHETVALDAGSSSPSQIDPVAGLSLQAVRLRSCGLARPPTSAEHRRTAALTSKGLVMHTIVLIHGLWLTPRSWEGWKARFEERGHRVLTPAWPHMDVEVEALRRDPSALKGLGVTEIVDHYDAIIRGLDAPPVIMGHSFGGLITELLLDRGLGAAAVAISPAPIKGVLRLPPAELRTSWPVLRNPFGKNGITTLTAKQFQFSFTNTMTVEEGRAAYERYAVPGPRRVLFQAAFANFNPRAATKVDFHKDDRAPLLIMGNTEDHTVPATVSKEAANRLGKSKAVVDYIEYDGRPHFTAGSPGWEEIADYALEWTSKYAHPPTPSSADA
jgi:pimeloyl-ACP methyl ester carboxylesterase